MPSSAACNDKRKTPTMDEHKQMHFPP